MLYLLGAGAAYPATAITNDFLEEVGAGVRAAWIDENTGIRQRSSVMSLDYIRSSGNLNVVESAAAIQTPTTELGYRAALAAIERAGIKPEEIGLVLGESSTPIETTPSEGQRVANRFGLRCPAYDVFGSSGSFALQLDTLMAMRPEVLPDYILCVSANAPTTHVNYREGNERVYFGDAGAAVIVSPRKQGKLRLTDTFFTSNPAFGDVLTIENFGHAEMRDDLLSEFIEPKTDEMLGRAIERNKLNAATVKFIGTQISVPMLDAIGQRHGIRPDHQLRNVAERGYSFGSSAASVLADSWDGLRRGDSIVVALSGAGFCFGFAHLVA